MKILFAFFVLFATQIIDLKAHLHWKKNALDITGVDKPQIKFWKNPFSNEKGMTAFRVKGGGGGRPFDGWSG